MATKIMSTNFSIGCVHCGQIITTNPPDSIHIEPHRNWKWNGFFIDTELIPMNAKCANCKIPNWILWYISTSKP